MLKEMLIVIKKGNFGVGRKCLRMKAESWVSVARKTLDG